MSLKESGHHFIAIFGGAVAGSEAAYQLAKRGFRVVVFDQGLLPYGKIEDGLPKWHWKLRNKEEQNIDQKINQPNIRFVPGVKLGENLDFEEVLKWGFTAIILATGAWKDRSLPIDGIDRFIGKGLFYQNPFVFWFNHHHEPEYKGPQYQIHDDALVIGGGLASLDVVKIIMIESVQDALRRKGINVDIFTLEHGIDKVLERYQLTMKDLGLKGCTLFYRRRAMDMPLTPMVTDTPEKLKKAQMIRKKILDNYQRKYLFKFKECCQPIDKLSTDDHLTGIKFQRTMIDGEKIEPVDDYFEVASRMVVSSIGSIPEKIKGIPSEGNIFRISDPESCQIDGFKNVFAIGNAVTGRGNINESMQHSREISISISEDFLQQQQDNYENWHRQTAKKVDQDIINIVEVINKSETLPDHVIQSIDNKTRNLQNQTGYNDNYLDWVKKHTPPRLENML